VLFIHARLTDETGGDHLLRDVGLLASAVARPRAVFAGGDLYPSLEAKAAALMQSLILNHPFLDGNKRTGITAAALFLLGNGRRLTADNAELERFTYAVTNGQVSLAGMALWFGGYHRRLRFSLFSESAP
jgi:death-on-curing protein